MLSSMQLITLNTFSEDGTTCTADEFLDRVDETCRQASMVCYKHILFLVNNNKLFVKYYNHIGTKSKEHPSRRSRRRSVESRSKS